MSSVIPVDFYVSSRGPRESRVQFATLAFAPPYEERTFPSPMPIAPYLRIHGEGCSPEKYRFTHRFGSGGQSKARHYYDTCTALQLECLTDTGWEALAICGFKLADSDPFAVEDDPLLLIKQIQGLPIDANDGDHTRELSGEEYRLLARVRFPPLLVHAMEDWSRIMGVPRIGILPAEQHKDYNTRAQHLRIRERNARLRIRYNHTAKKRGFSPPNDDIPYWWKDL